MADDLDGAVVVTGAAQGIGFSVAEAFASAGRLVVVSDVRGDAADDAAATLRAAGGRAVGVACDVADEAQIRALGAAAMEAGDSIVVWVNNAGVSRPAMLHKMELSDFEWVLRVHTIGTFLGIREAARRMIDRGNGGCILNVTSAAGLQGTIGQINYAAAKGAITAMTKSAARELAKRNIRVNAVAPVAATPMTQMIRSDEKLAAKYTASIPLGRFAEPTEVASMFTYLASPAAAYVTGQVMCIDGGLYMAS